MNISFVHTNIVADDWRELADFYIDVFGCVPVPQERDLSGEWLDDLTSLENARIRGIHLRLPGFDENGPTLEIFEYDQQVSNPFKQTNTSGFAHIAFSVDDVEECLKKVLRYGGSIVGDLVKTDIEGLGEIYVVYARDPEDNIIELQKKTSR